MHSELENYNAQVVDISYHSNFQSAGTKPLSNIPQFNHDCFVCVVDWEKTAFGFKTTSLFHMAEIMHVVTHKICYI